MLNWVRNGLNSQVRMDGSQLDQIKLWELISKSRKGKRGTVAEKTAHELALLAEQQQDEMLEVVKYQAEGRSKQWIKNKTGLSGIEQTRIKEEFDRAVVQDDYMKQRARVAVAEIDQHYTTLIKRFYEAVDDAESAGNYNDKSRILKQIVDTEKARTDFLHRAGLLAEDHMGDQVVEAQEKIEQIKTILRSVAKEYPEAGKLIAQKLSELDGTVVSRRVDAK